MKEIAQFFTDESVLHLSNGEVVKGAENVSNVIINCCRAYNRGYLEGMAKFVGKGILMGAVITGSVIFVRGVIKSNKNKNKEEA